MLAASTPGADAPSARASHARGEPTGRYLGLLALGALGVVFGDIGTSPLYTMREAFGPHYGIAPTPANVLGVLSLIFWALIIIISIKYVVFVMRADNRGEGGMIALTALVAPRRATAKKGAGFVILGLFGASLLYGDSMITPAISVLSAVEGLEIATPLFRPYVIPITIVILIALFAVQSRGTGGIGRVFGPVMLTWFIVLALLGLGQLVHEPGVLRAVLPSYGAAFFAHNGWHGFLILGAVFLSVTGAEALYADMGHFGRRPIRLAWFLVGLPALMLNYFGQGALLLRNPSSEIHPFFHLAPEWALYPVVALATMATVIASQAVISGAFSLTRQAVQLGYLPRVDIEHTSAREIGQIYIPGLNWLLMIACVGLVIGFRSSTRLAAAYGVAVTTDMVFTTILFALVARKRWNWSWAKVAALAGLFLVVDLGFWSASIIKIPHGGWYPLVVGAIIFTMMSTWKRGRRILAERMHSFTVPLDVFLTSLMRNPPPRVPGTAVFMFGGAQGTPPALLHNLKHNKVIHEQVVLLTVITEEFPFVEEPRRVRAAELGNGFYRITLSFGFMEDPNVPEVLKSVELPGLNLNPMQTSYFLGRETLIASNKPGMALWREKLFAAMAQNARPATRYFGLPPNRVVELGAQIEI